MVYGKGSYGEQPEVIFVKPNLLDEPVSQRALNRVLSPVNLKLGQDVMDMILYRAESDLQLS